MIQAVNDCTYGYGVWTGRVSVPMQVLAEKLSDGYAIIVRVTRGSWWEAGFGLAVGVFVWMLTLRGSHVGSFGLFIFSVGCGESYFGIRLADRFIAAQRMLDEISSIYANETPNRSLQPTQTFGLRS